MKPQERVEIVEVSLRDGLQNESWILPAQRRIQLAEALAGSGLTRIEAGSFVNSRWVPQMADSDVVLRELLARQSAGLSPLDVTYSALVPNEHGLEDALATGIKEVAIFSAASETFSLRNTNCTIGEGFERFRPVVERAHKARLKVRAYVSTCFACPYEGRISVDKVVDVARQLFEMGCYEISIGDTIGVGTPRQVEELFLELFKKIPARSLAGHFHDTNGTGLANIYKAFNMGVRVFDSSRGGLGGCPYAPGSRGNVSTESVVFLFNGLNVYTGVSLEKLRAIQFS